MVGIYNHEVGCVQFTYAPLGNIELSCMYICVCVVLLCARRVWQAAWRRYLGLRSVGGEE